MTSHTSDLLSTLSTEVTPVLTGKYKGRLLKSMRQADKVKALVEAGVQRVQVQEQLGISKASYYRCLSG